jgi:hypothetical protein
MKLGTRIFLQEHERIEFAQTYFLRISNEFAPDLLREVCIDIFPEYRKKRDVDPMIVNWCKRSNFVVHGEAAPWVVDRLKWSLAWWKRGKPTPQQTVTRKRGRRSVEPPEWYDRVTIMGLPVILKEGETSPFEHRVTYELGVRSDESEKESIQRLLKRHRSGRTALLAAHERAVAIQAKLLSKSPSLGGLESHVKWAVLFQFCAHEVPDILKRVSADETTVNKGINSALRLVGLTRRRSRLGRPRKVTKSPA